MAKPTAMESIATQMEPLIKVTGWLTASMALALRRGQMALHTKGLTSLARSMERMDGLSGATTLAMKDNSETIISKAKGPMCGQTAALTKEIGETIRCMEKECSHGLLLMAVKKGAKCILANIEMIKSMAMERSVGPTEGNMQDNGHLENSMATESTKTRREKVLVASGQMVSV